MRNVARVALIAAAMTLLLAGCFSPEPAATRPLRLWPVKTDDESMAAWFQTAEHRWLLDRSTWFAYYRASDARPKSGEMGDFAIGNGSVFSQVGVAFPVNTLHEMIGPVYQREDSKFFADTWIDLARDGVPVTFEESWVWRARGAPVVLTKAKAGDISLYTVDFAPYGGAAAPEAKGQNAVYRIAIVESDSAAALQLRIRTALLDKPVGSLPFDENLGGRLRRTEVQGSVGQLQGDDGSRFIPVSASKPIVLRYATVAAGGTPPVMPPTFAEVDSMLAGTRNAWRQWLHGGATLHTPDVKVNDLYEGLLLTMKTQQASNGAMTQMSQYTGSWLRDVLGPARFLLRTGHAADVKALLDYLYQAALMTGDIENSYRADFAGPVPAPPDWLGLPCLEGRVAAESPSALILTYREYVRATGDTTGIPERWDYLRAALLRQTMTAAGEMTFSGDETYRTAMSVAFDLAPDYSFETQAWSANSSFLFVAAAEAMAELAARIDRDTAEAGQYLRLAGEVRAAAEEMYRTPNEDFYRPFLIAEDLIDPASLGCPAHGQLANGRTGQAGTSVDRTAVEARPFEDVNLQPLWVGYKSADDPVAEKNLQATIDHLGDIEGNLYSIQAYAMPGFESLGVYTGMVPGFYLYNLAAARHPLAEAAFNALEFKASTSGNYGEYQLAHSGRGTGPGDDGYRPRDSVLQLIYNPDGGFGDYTARYRSWEGGINGEALVYYLTGIEFGPDSSQAPPVSYPQLPNGWDGLTFENFSAGTRRFDLTVRRGASGQPVAAIRLRQ